jgi:hypothetical protein
VAVPPATGVEVGASLVEVVFEADCDAVSEGDDATAVCVGDTLDATVLGVDEQPANATRNRSESGAMRPFMRSLLRDSRRALAGAPAISEAASMGVGGLPVPTGSGRTATVHADWRDRATARAVAACERYRKLPVGDSTFSSMTIEELLAADVLPAQTAADLRQRYLPARARRDRRP